MTKQQLSIFHPAFLIATVCGVGKAPFAPGTCGSAATFLLLVPIVFFSNITLEFCNDFFPWIADYSYYITSLYCILFAVVLYIVGIWATTIYMDATGKHDPKEVVIDEVVGQLITIALAFPALIMLTQDMLVYQFWIVSSGLFFLFLLFRFFDIVKPWLVGWADQKVEGALGVMLDDVFAGIFAGIVAKIVFIILLLV